MKRSDIVAIEPMKYFLMCVARLCYVLDVKFRWEPFGLHDVDLEFVAPPEDEMADFLHWYEKEQFVEQTVKDLYEIVRPTLPKRG